MRLIKNMKKIYLFYMFFNTEIIPIMIISFFFYLQVINSYYCLYISLYIFFIIKLMNIFIIYKFNFSNYQCILNGLLDTKITVLYIGISIISLTLLKKNAVSYFFYISLLYFIYYLILNVNLFKYKLYYATNILMNLNLFNNDFSVELINGLFFLHPMFFSFTIIYICYFSKINYFEKIIQFYNNKNFNFIKSSNLILVLFIILFSVISGSWWAQQELNWSGWWSWDNIELINFFELTLLITIVHQISYFKNNFNKLILLILFVSITIMLLRFNLVLTRHTFLINLNELQFSIYGVYIIIIVLIYIIIVFNYTTKITSKKVFYKKQWSLSHFNLKFSYIFFNKLNFIFLFSLILFLLLYFFLNFIGFYKNIFYFFIDSISNEKIIQTLIFFLINFFLFNLTSRYALFTNRANNLYFLVNNFFLKFYVYKFLYIFLKIRFYKNIIKNYKALISVLHVFFFKIVLCLLFIKIISYIYNPLFLLDFLLFNEFTFNSLLSNIKLTTFYLSSNSNKKMFSEIISVYNLKTWLYPNFLNINTSFLQNNVHLLGSYIHNSTYQSLNNNVIMLFHSTGLYTSFKELWLLTFSLVFFILFFVLNVI